MFFFEDIHVIYSYYIPLNKKLLQLSLTMIIFFGNQGKEMYRQRNETAFYKVVAYWKLSVKRVVVKRELTLSPRNFD